MMIGSNMKTGIMTKTLRQGNSMTEREISSLQESTSYYWRVRYRDRSLGWSDWSDPIGFSTSLSIYSANLILNPGAEGGTSSWTTVSGSFESILSGECAGNNSHSGARLFAVGGVCDPNAYGEGYQDIDLLSYSSMIDNDSAIVFFGGYLSDYSGDDIPAFYLEFYNAGNSLLGSTMSYESSSPDWEYLFDNIASPCYYKKNTNGFDGHKKCLEQIMTVISMTCSSELNLLVMTASSSLLTLKKIFFLLKYTRTPQEMFSF